MSSAMLGIYTITPLHCGTGQTAGAVDLPVARESTTGFPFIPGTALKGVLRDTCEPREAGPGPNADCARLFGSSNGSGDGQTSPGALAIFEGQLLALPQRCLHAPFVYATSPLLIERLVRTARALGIEHPALPTTVPALPEGKAVGIARQHPGTLVIEDIVFANDEILRLGPLQQLGTFFSHLLPSEESATRERLQRDLVLLPDDTLQELASRTLPVTARTHLTPGKTTDKYTDANGKEHKGNLWYEETVPTDTLFVSYVRELPRARARAASSEPDASSPLSAFRELLKQRQARVLQIGGNETVGEGYCWCQELRELDREATP